VEPYVWHATEKGLGYGEVEFPSPLNDCQACHLPNTYDFTALASMTAMPNIPMTTVATGKYNKDPTANPSYYTLSPYVVADNLKDYGAGPAFAGATGAFTEGAGTNLVISPVMTVCSACHDSPIAMDHMKANGGRFYDTRANALAAGAAKEQCAMCHGPGKVAAIGVVHQR
jgi:OmcA/MtrC family decaheme c-type cytochrome